MAGLGNHAVTCSQWRSVYLRNRCALGRPARSRSSISDLSSTFQPSIGSDVTCGVLEAPAAGLRTRDALKSVGFHRRRLRRRQKGPRSRKNQASEQGHQEHAIGGPPQSSYRHARLSQLAVEAVTMVAPSAVAKPHGFAHSTVSSSAYSRTSRSFCARSTSRNGLRMKPWICGALIASLSISSL